MTRRTHARFIAIPPRRLVAAALLAVQIVSVSACSFAGQPVGVQRYRVIDDRTLSVLSTTGPGYETWIDSVIESPTTVVVAAKMRPNGFDQKAPGAGEDVWLTIHLQAPLGDREVIDAAGNQPVPIVP